MHKGYAENEYGTRISKHVCDTCGEEFTLCPAMGEERKGWENCMDETCPSYDANRDADILFMSDDEIREKKKTVSLQMMEARDKVERE